MELYNIRRSTKRIQVHELRGKNIVIDFIIRKMIVQASEVNITRRVRHSQ